MELEKQYGSVRPDILLTRRKDGEVLFVEIAVSHQSEEPKIGLGKRILEIKIHTEEQAVDLGFRMIDLRWNNVKTHNFKEEQRIAGDFCKGDCHRELAVFKVFHSQKSILLSVAAKDLAMELSKGRPKLANIVGFTSYIFNGLLYTDSVREAYFDGIPIKNCYLCRYHGVDAFETGVFCKIEKTSVNSNLAVECDKYRPFKSRAEANESDRKNEEYQDRQLGIRRPK